ncbi:MAG: PQQ-like beta-propeller repeat protein [Gemmataceae bacterium]|nr:PQQ-like beta-propeller repeat protein [Gemmataceae bacterium]
MSRICVLLLPVLAADLGAQERREPPPGRSFPVQQRLRAVDALLEPIADYQDLALLLGGLHGHPLTPAASLALVKADNYEQAYEEYRRILRNTPEALVAPHPLRASDQNASVAFRQVFHARISRMPPRILRRYRDEVEADAKALWDVGDADHQAEPLLRIAEEFLASRYGDLAIDRLGGMAFQAGRFDEARAWWRRLTAPIDEPATPYAFPDSRFDAALVRAKQILATIFEGKLEGAERQLTLFRKAHGDAQATLAAEKGLLHEILAKQLGVREKHLASDLDLPWGTFAGNASRNRVLATPPPSTLWRDGPAWRVKIQPSKEMLAVGTPRKPPLHPCIAYDQVFVSEGHHVMAYHLLTGKESFRYPPGPAFVEEDGPQGGWSRPAPTVGEHRVFAVMRPETRKSKGESAYVNTLVALQADGNDVGKLLWKREAKTPEGQAAVFDSRPLLVGSRLYAVMRRTQAARTKTWVVCLDMEGRVRWTEELAEITEPEHDPGRPPLVWAGDRIVHVSNAGWAAALHPRTGEKLWTMRYSDTAKIREGKPVHEGAAFASDGVVVFAPADQPRVVAVDAIDGRTLWSLPLEAVDLLGASNGRAFVVAKLGMEAIDLRSGESRRRWRQPGEGRLPTLGRGLLAGGWIFWPTQDPRLAWRTLTQAEGLPQKPLSDGPPREPNYFDPMTLFRVPAGETAFGQGCMAVATADELVVYVPNRRLVPKLLPEARDDRPATLYRLASASREEGRNAEANAFHATLMTIVPSAERDAWRKLAFEVPAPTAVLRNAGAWQLPKDRPVSPKLAGGPLEKIWSGRIDGTLLPTDPADASHFFMRQGKAIHAYGIDGTDAWSAESRFSATWAAKDARLAFFAGAEGFEARDIRDGSLVWAFANPLLAPWSLRNDRPLPPQALEPLHGFRLHTDKVSFQVGSRAFVQLHSHDGTIASLAAAPGSQLRPLGGWGYLACDSPKVRPASCLVLGDAAGLQLHRVAEVSGDNQGVAVGLPRGEVECRRSDGTVRWTFRPEDSHSLTGEPARVFSIGDRVLALTPRNLGDEWLRLDPELGTVIWKLDPGTFRETLRLDGMAFDDAAWFICTQDALEARSLRTGQKLWRCALPAEFAGWRPVVVKHGVLAYPIAKPPKPELCGPPNPEPRMKDAPSEAPIFLFDAKDGQALRRLAISYRGGPIDVQLSTHWLLVATGRTIHAYCDVDDVAKR